ncbi:carbon-nitrogen hydrolase family protein [Sandaracinobacteroides saxicola]|uniref:Carbon-nitrogen hydrolase family protein n=1 Tax=Sandaracinobacteroides saxicola TaxID=2759707 RepID=A0A7G5IDL8_9SPHN|nr:carbon-nitrogen hydrolase family protein [Sandaracinobacteroides saxicola]QMW21460.1 carbon-nitrogen hydrolase family protein [Sandaracinobacteroides saxicola]
MRLAAAHIASVFMDTAASIAKAVEWIGRAGEQGVDLLVFPEVFLPGFPHWINLYPPLVQAGLNARYHAASIAADGPELAAIAEAARQAKLAVVIGFSERGRSGTCFNSSATIDRDGRIAAIHRKLKPTYAERTVWGEGDGAGLVVPHLSGIGRVSSLICWEHTMNLARQVVAEQGAVIHAAHWPGLSTLAGFDSIADVQIEAMMRNHALTGQCVVVCAAGPVGADLIAFLHRELGEQAMLREGGGWSAIIHPFAATLAGPVTGGGEQMLVAELDVAAAVAEVKMWVDGSGHYGRPDVLRLHFDSRPRQTMQQVELS